MSPLELEIVGHYNEINVPNPDGSMNMRLFPCGEASYSVTFNDDGVAVLRKTFKDPFSISFMPYFGQKYLDALNEGKIILIDDDIVRLKK